MASVASTYARAFADVVLSAHLDADRSIAELRMIASLLNESADLRRVWENPAVPAEQKRRLLDVIAERDGISKQVRNLVAVLMDHRRIHFLESIVVQLEKELDARLGFAEADILGGAVVRLGSTIYDGSVKGQLEKIKEAISS
jgi:F-type H+-transporting ATPase subunit delta